MPKGMPPNEALRVALRSFMTTGQVGMDKSADKGIKPQASRPSEPLKDSNSTPGGNFGGGFGSGMPPFLDSMGMGDEIKPTTTSVTFEASTIIYIKSQFSHFY